jgi:hypothetical protein
MKVKRCLIFLNFGFASMDDNKCPICLEDLLYGRSPIGGLYPCGHVFHETCFDSWVKTKKKDKADCPTCKKKCQFVKLFISLLTSTDDLEEDNYPYGETDDQEESLEYNGVENDNVMERKMNRYRKMRKQIQSLSDDVTSLKMYKDQYIQLKKVNDDLIQQYDIISEQVKEYQERQVSYESHSVEVKLQMLRKDRVIEGIREEMNAIQSEFIEYKQKQDRESKALTSELQEAKKTIDEYKQNRDRQNSTLRRFMSI